MNNILRIVWYGVQGFKRHIWLSVIAVITMTLTLATITVFVLGSAVVSRKYHEFNSKIDYNIFIKDSASEADVQQMRTDLNNRPEVAKLVYLSKEDVQKSFEQRFKNIESLQGVITPDNNPLPREIDIKFNDPNQMEPFDKYVSQPRYSQIVEKTSYSNNKNIVSSYLRITNFLRGFALSFTGFFLFIAILVILNTIRLAIHSRRQEIEIMRLVGASRGYIRGPFLVEGGLFGLLGALIATLGSALFLYQLRALLVASADSGTTNVIYELFNSSLSEITTKSGLSSLVNHLFLLQLTIGVALGVLCSTLAVRRYLREYVR